MTASPAFLPESSQGKSSGEHSTRVSTSSSTPIHQTVKRMKKWQVFPGRNKFMCDGRLIMARQTGILYFTISLILITVALFFGFECRLTLVTQLQFGFLIPVACGLLFFFNMFCLLRTAWSDPGIIPRATAEEAAYTNKLLADETAKQEGAGYRPPPRILDITINGIPMKLKYCFTCKIFRPPRASHCSLCDNCVDNFDHHCPWVGNCVGRRNYRYFYLFVTSLTILCLFIFSFSIVHIVLLSGIENGFVNALKISPGSVLEILICFFSIWSVIGLSGFHSYLVVQSLTTNEDIKGTWSRKRNPENKNPFDRGSSIKNCFYVLCSPLPPSFIDRRGYVDENDLPNPDLVASNRQNGADHQSTSRQQPVMDIEPYDSNGASYPRQPRYPQQPSTNQNSIRSMAGGDTVVEMHDDEPTITISHHALNNSLSQPSVSYNSNDSRERPSQTKEQPGVIIQHMGAPPSVQYDSRSDEHNVSVLTVGSADSHTLLLDDSPKLLNNGLSSKPVEKANGKVSKISSV